MMNVFLQPLFVYLDKYALVTANVKKYAVAVYHCALKFSTAHTQLYRMTSTIVNKRVIFRAIQMLYTK